MFQAAPTLRRVPDPDNLAMAPDRMLVARLQHRLGFGPRPGDYLAAVRAGFQQSRSAALKAPSVDAGTAGIGMPSIRDLGPPPASGTPDRTAYENSKRVMQNALQLWALDRMVAADHGLTERLTWFWQGHWATAIGKVDTPLLMFNYYLTLNSFALGNFADMTKAMVNDAAVIYWLDGGQNTASAPNENLARELMELFTLGIGSYSEDDVKGAAKALTGYKVDRNSGIVTFKAKDHFSLPISLLGKVGLLDANSLADLLTSNPQCSYFIAERLWYRFISSTEALPMRSKIPAALAKKLSISDGVQALAYDPGFADPKNAQVKAPVDWFVSVCRALGLMPSQLAQQIPVLNLLRSLSQVVFDPPSVGGWPADEAWLSTASADLRIKTAVSLVKLGDLSPISSLPEKERVQGAADWLGVAHWTSRTRAALLQVSKNPADLAALAITAPEYLVSA